MHEHFRQCKIIKNHFVSSQVRVGKEWPLLDNIPLFDIEAHAHNVHAEKSFQNLIESNRNQIVITIFRLILNSKRVRPFAVLNQSEKCKYNLISV